MRRGEAIFDRSLQSIGTAIPRLATVCRVDRLRECGATRVGREACAAASRLRAGDEAGRPGLDGSLQEPEARQAALPGGTPVEPEDELVEVGLQMLGLRSALAGAEQAQPCHRG